MENAAAWKAEEVLECALDIGERMLVSGAEVYRVEDTISRVCKAYGMQRADTFAIPSSIVVTVRPFGGMPVTQTRRIVSSNINLDRVDRLNQLSRDICRDRCAPAEVLSRLREIDMRPSLPAKWRMFSYVLGSSAFSAFFGGDPGDACSAGLGALLIYILQCLFHKIGFQNVLASVACSGTAAAFAFICSKIGIGHHLDKIVIGEIMLLIPGLELTNGMRDLMAGDILAGLTHLCEAIFMAVGIAVGAAGMLALLGVAAS